MTDDEYYQAFLQIQEKILQVLRIKKKLEERRYFYIQKLRSSPVAPDLKETLEYLHSLFLIYEREEKVLLICKKGLDNAGKIVNAVGSTISVGDLVSKLKYKAISKLPLFGERYGRDGSSIGITIQLKLLYSLIGSQIAHIEENIYSIKELINLQRKHLEKIIAEVEARNILENVTMTKYFEALEEFHRQELEVINGIDNKSKKGEIVEAINYIKVALSQSKIIHYIKSKMSENRTLAQAQGFLVSVPTVGTIATVGTIFLGLEFLPTLYLAGQFVKYGPSLAILSKELVKLTTSPSV